MIDFSVCTSAIPILNGKKKEKSEQNGNSFYRVQDGLDRKNVKKRRKLFQNTSQKPRKFAYKPLQQALYAMFLGANAPV